MTALYDRLVAALNGLAAERDQRSAVIGDEPAWVGYEAQQMLILICEARAEAGLPPVNLHQVRTIEHRAACHFMGTAYVERYAARCADLAAA